MNRRTFLQTAALIPVRLSAQPAPGPALKDRAASRKVLFGAAAAWPALKDDAEYAEHFARECAVLVPENVLKMQVVHPEPDRYNFAPADFMAEFAAKHGMKMRGHTLVWHQQMAPWFRNVVNKDNAGRILEEHVRTVVGRYKGRMHSWDVVNEAVEPKDAREDGLRKTPWLDVLGPEYIDLAFRFAREADPAALLCYNDYGLDYATPGDEQKRAAVLKLLRGLKQRRVPVHAFGMQAHLNAGNQKNFDPDSLRRFLGDVAALGLQIMITELDAVDRDLPDDIAERDKGIARVYGSYLNAALREPAVTAVLTWGLTDKYTWLATRNRRASGVPVRVLPLDRDYARKPAWEAIAGAFDAR